MSLPIQDYGLIGDLHTAALVGKDGSIDWLCLPRFDSEACFAGLLGEDRHGHWRIAPAGGNTRVERRYRPDTLVLETEFTVDSGTARLVDCMPPRESDPVLVRMIEGVSGTVDLRMTLAAAFEYGSAEPRVRRPPGAHRIVAGSETLWLFGPAHVRRSRGSATAELTVSQGDKVPFAVVWRSSRDDPPDPPLVPAVIDRTERWGRGGGPDLRGQGARGGGPVHDHGQGPHLRADRRGRGRAHHLAATAGIRLAELGLPALLAAGRRRGDPGAAARR